MSINIQSLRGQKNFRKVFEQGNKIVTRNFVAIGISPIENINIIRGVVASKKVGNAVKRNLAKRRIRESSRIIFTNLNIKSIECVFIARVGILKCEFNQLLRDMKFAVNKLNKE